MELILGAPLFTVRFIYNDRKSRFFNDSPTKIKILLLNIVISMQSNDHFQLVTAMVELLGVPSENDGFCIQNDGFCIQNDGFRIQNGRCAVKRAHRTLHGSRYVPTPGEYVYTSKVTICTT